MRKRYSKEVADKLANYAMSELHAIVAILAWLHMTFISCRLPGETFFSNVECLDATSAGMEVNFLISLSYLVGDMMYVKAIFGPGSTTTETCIHHVVGIIGFLSALILKRLVGVIAMSILMTELSTIFLNVMLSMRLLDKIKSNPTFFKINSLFLGVSFFASRIVYMAYLLFFIVGPEVFKYDYASAA